LAVYEDRLIQFQKAISASKSAGFRESAVFRVSSLPWVQGASASYEERYLLEGSFGLDPLNEAAISSACRGAHDAAAQLAAGGTAGLYRLRVGEPVLTRVQFCYWFAKPARTSYEDFYSRLRPVTVQPGIVLWGRQMVLGPTPEFCLDAPIRVKLPADLQALEVELRRSWPG